MPELSEGTLLMGRYRVLEQLGAGEHGTVVGAFDETLRRDVAIKILHATGDEARERLFREAEASGALDSEHVVKVHVADVDAELGPYIVMERLRGDDLAALVARTGPLPLAVAARYVLEAMAGVAAAHARGIVHRDLKPSNLFLASDGGRSIVKVVDFGIAKLTERADVLTKTGARMGTPRYMAPEQLRSARRADERTDVWALANTLHELIGGVPSTSATPRVSREQIPAEIAAWMQSCLARDPTLRPGLARAAQELAVHTPEGAALARRVVSALGDAPAPRAVRDEASAGGLVRRPKARTPAWVVYVAAFTAVVVLGPLAYAIYTLGTPGRPPTTPSLPDASPSPVAPMVSSSSALFASDAASPSDAASSSDARPVSSVDARASSVDAGPRRPRGAADTASANTGITCTESATCPRNATCSEGRCTCATDMFFCGGACRLPDERYCRGCKPCGPREVCVVTLGHPLCGTQGPAN